MTNVEKCVTTPIRCTEEMVATVQQVFPCVITAFPCKYLGAPLSVTSLKCSDEQKLVDAVMTKIPTWKTSMLNMTGRLALTKSTLSVILVNSL